MEYAQFQLPMGGVPGGSTNAYLLGAEPAVLIDPGSRSPALDEAVENATVGAIVVTHTHPDHVGALAHYAATTDATVYARRWRVGRFERATGVTPDRTLAEGDVVPVGGDDAEIAGDADVESDADVDGDGVIRVLETPGHAVDHLAFETPAGVVCGDLAIAKGSLAVTAPGGDMRAYMTSLRRLHARKPRALLPGHGPVADDPQATLRRLIDHRRQRERRVLAAVEGGAHTLDAVLDAAYDKDLTGVRGMAAGTVRAHLQKLDAEGAIDWDRATGRARTTA
jgi:glyoxylase-like metal-dependent hydrolase (beta-lactamase superfamily II)